MDAIVSSRNHVTGVSKKRKRVASKTAAVKGRAVDPSSEAKEKEVVILAEDEGANDPHLSTPKKPKSLASALVKGPDEEPFRPDWAIRNKDAVLASPALSRELLCGMVPPVDRTELARRTVEDLEATIDTSLATAAAAYGLARRRSIELNKALRMNETKHLAKIESLEAASKTREEKMAECKEAFEKAKARALAERERRREAEQKVAQLEGRLEKAEIKKKAAVRAGRVEARKAVYKSRRYHDKMYQILEDGYRKGIRDARARYSELDTSGLHPLLGTNAEGNMAKFPFALELPGHRPESDYEGESGSDELPWGAKSEEEEEEEEEEGQSDAGGEEGAGDQTVVLALAPTSDPADDKVQTP